MSTKYLPVANGMRSFWLSEEDTKFANLRTSQGLPKEVEILVVGSGYAGTAFSYYLLQNPSIDPSSVLVLEARTTCSGATSRNGGHLKPDLYHSYNKFVKRYGEKEAADIINFEYNHLKAFKDLIDLEQISCDFILTRACDVHLTPEAVHTTISNYNSMLKNPYITNKQDVQIKFGEEARVISKVEKSPVCLTYTAGHLWPYKLIIGILRKLVAKGIQLQTNTPVLGTNKLSNGKYLVKTERGFILTKKLIIATNAYTASVEPRFENKIVPIKGACAHIVSADRAKRTPYLTNTYGIRYDGANSDYLINRSDGTIIVGGAKKHIFPYPEHFYNVVDDSNLIQGTKEYFDNYMKDRFYTWKNFDEKCDNVWSGILGYTDDSLPYVGELPGDKNKFILAGFHGHGMPRVLLCAKALAAVVGGMTDDLDIPAPFKITEKRMTETKNEILEGLYIPGKPTKL